MLTMWTAYLILIHLLAVPGLYMVLGIGLTAFLESTTNPLTGETKPWARGMGWAAIGAAVVLIFWFVMEAW
jgi:hypothetical protein